MLGLSVAVKLWFCAAAVDMRLGYDGLFSYVQSHLKAAPLSGHLLM